MLSEISDELKSDMDNGKTKEDLSLGVPSILLSHSKLNMSIQQSENIKIVYDKFVQRHKSFRDQVEILQEKNAAHLQNLNKKQMEIELLQAKLQKNITVIKLLEESTRDYNKQVVNLKEIEQSNYTNLNEKCLLIDSLQDRNNKLQNDNDSLQTKNRELNHDYERLNSALTDLQNENMDLRNKYEILLSENNNLKTYSRQLQSKDSCEAIADLKADTSNTEMKNLNYEKIADLAVDDLELSDNDDDGIQYEKVSVMTNTEPWECFRCKDLEMEVSYQKAIRACTLLPRLLSPIPEDIQKTLRSVLTQTEAEIILPKVTDWTQNTENSSVLCANRQMAEFNSIVDSRNIINTLSILSELQRNRDKLLKDVDIYGHRTTADCGELDLISPNALPEVLKLMFRFIHDVIGAIQEAFEVITKQFNKIHITNYTPQIGEQIIYDTINEQTDFSIIKPNKKRSYEKILDTHNSKIGSEFEPHKKRKPKVPIHISAKFRGLELADEHSNNIQESIKININNKMRMNVENETSEVIQGYINKTKINQCPDSLINHHHSSSDSGILADDADALRMKRNVDIFSKAKLKKNKKINIKANLLNTEANKSTSPKVNKKTIRNGLFDCSDSDDNIQIKKIKCTNGKINYSVRQDKILPDLQSRVVEIPFNLETNVAEGSTLTNTNILSNSDLILQSTIKDNIQHKVYSGNATDEIRTSLKLIDVPYDSEIVGSNDKILINKSSSSPICNSASGSKSSDNSEDEINGLNCIEDHLNSSMRSENIKQVTALNFYQDNIQKIVSNDSIDITADEKFANTSINAEIIMRDAKALNFYEEQQSSPEKDVTQKINKSEIYTNISYALPKEKLFNIFSSENPLNKNGTQVSKSQNLNVVASTVSCDKSNALPTELIKNGDRTSSIISNANSNLQTVMMEQMIDHQYVENHYLYESNDKPIYVFHKLLNQYVLVNRWKALTAQFSNIPQTCGKNFEKKIKQVKEILLPFVKEPNTIPSLPVTIGKLQELNMPDLSVIVLKCILYNMSTEWYNISKTNQNPAGKLVGLLYHLSQIFNNFLDFAINAISYKLFRLKQDKDKDDFIQLYSQIYIGLCLKCHKYSTLQTFLVDCLYCFHFKCITILQQLLAVCPTILQVYDPNIKENLLHTTMKYLIWELKSNGEKLSTSPNLTRVKQTIYFTYKIPEDSKTLDGLLAKILQKAIDSPDIEVYYSTMLLARRESPAWVLNKLINQGFLTLLQSSWNEYVDSMLINTSKASNKSDCGKQIYLTPKLKTVKLCVDVLGTVGRPLDEANKDKVISIIFLMKTMLGSKVLDSIPELQEAIISALIQLSRHQYDAVLDAIMLWKPKFLPSTRLVNKLKRFVHRKHYRFWKNKLDNEYVSLT